MAARAGEGMKHSAPRGRRELSGTHGYDEHRRRSSEKMALSLMSQEGHPRSFNLSTSRATGRVRSKEPRKIQKFDLFAAYPSSRGSTQDLSRSHGQRPLASKSFPESQKKPQIPSSVHEYSRIKVQYEGSRSSAQQVSERQATSVLFPGEHTVQVQGTASIFSPGASSSSNHGQHGFSQEQGLSRSQRQLPYPTGQQDISKSQVQLWPSTPNQGPWKGYAQATGYPGYIRVDVFHHFSPPLQQVFPSMQQPSGPFANFGAVIDDIYSFLRGL